MAETDFVQYHNADKHGRWPRLDGPRVSIYWTGNRSLPLGTRVWLITGETVGGKKKYWITYRFVVDKVDYGADENVASAIREGPRP